MTVGVEVVGCARRAKRVGPCTCGQCVLHTMPSAKKKTNARASNQGIDIMPIIPFEDGGIQHMMNCAFGQAQLVAEFEKMPPDARREAMLNHVGVGGVAMARAAVDAYNTQPIGTPDTERLAAAAAAHEAEKLKWMADE